MTIFVERHLLENSVNHLLHNRLRCVFISLQVQDIHLEIFASLSQHINVSVRKAVVDCIVEMQIKLGAEGISGLNSRMSSAQLKLVQIVYEGALRKRQRQAANAS